MPWLALKSVGKGKGYRCRKCGTREDGKEEGILDRGLELGWYEVPPCARRHLSRPLSRA